MGETLTITHVLTSRGPGYINPQTLEGCYSKYEAEGGEEVIGGSLGFGPGKRVTLSEGQIYFMHASTPDRESNRIYSEGDLERWTKQGMVARLKDPVSVQL